MKIVQPSHKFETPIDGEHGRAMIRLIESAARTCYKSECKITPESASAFVRRLAQVHKHRSVIEHANVTIRFVCDRGVSHELVRHRVASFSQESTRYCNYGDDEKFGGEITTIIPIGLERCGEYAVNAWREAMQACEACYMLMLRSGCPPQLARSVLPNSLKTEVVMTANLREWHHVLSLRAHKAAHPDMQRLMRPVLADFRQHLPEIFDDIPENQ